MFSDCYIRSDNTNLLLWPLLISLWAHLESGRHFEGKTLSYCLQSKSFLTTLANNGNNQTTDLALLCVRQDPHRSNGMWWEQEVLNITNFILESSTGKYMCSVEKQAISKTLVFLGFGGFVWCLYLTSPFSFVRKSKISSHHLFLKPDQDHVAITLSQDRVAITQSIRRCWCGVQVYSCSVLCFQSTCMGRVEYEKPTYTQDVPSSFKLLKAEM